MRTVRSGEHHCTAFSQRTINHEKKWLHFDNAKKPEEYGEEKIKEKVIITLSTVSHFLSAFHIARIFDVGHPSLGHPLTFFFWFMWRRLREALSSSLLMRFYSCCTIGGATNSQSARTLAAPASRTDGKSTKEYLLVITA
jgi:hypothetical protein